MKTNKRFRYIIITHIVQYAVLRGGLKIKNTEDHPYPIPLAPPLHVPATPGKQSISTLPLVTHHVAGAHWPCISNKAATAATVPNILPRPSRVSVEVSPGCHAHLLERHVSKKLHFLHETMRREKEVVSPW
jgi:hypothetical protein